LRASRRPMDRCEPTACCEDQRKQIIPSLVQGSFRRVRGREAHGTAPPIRLGLDMDFSVPQHPNKSSPCVAKGPLPFTGNMESIRLPPADRLVRQRKRSSRKRITLGTTTAIPHSSLSCLSNVALHCPSVGSDCVWCP
jgi:hypothetical protein